MYQPKLRKKRNGIPIMCNSEIDAHAEKFLIDYNPSILKNPQPVSIEEFAEFYLNLTLDYTFLSHCGLILGRMVFQDTERVPIYLPEQKCADYLYAKRGTMLIDNVVLEDWKEYRLRSTIGHECGHWVFHSDFYAHAHSRNHHEKISAPEITGCKKTDIEEGLEIAGKRRLITDIDWLEHHAKYFSAAILMPKTPFINAASDLMENRHLNEIDFAEALSRIFQVSSISASIRLAQLGFNEYAGKNVKTTTKENLTCSGRFQALCE